jgi:hypothetical protein
MKKTILLLAGILVAFPDLNMTAAESGQWEFNVHYSLWSINLVRPLIEDAMGDLLEDNLRDKFMEEIRRDYPSARETAYSQQIQFDSNGRNYGFELRWFPGGHRGSFSLGLAVEKTTMKIGFPTIDAQMSAEVPEFPGRTGNFTGSVENATLELKPLSYHLSFRWEIVPRAQIHPFVTFGVGMFMVGDLEKGSFYAAWRGDFVVPGISSRHYEGIEDKTVKDFIDESKDEGDEVKLPGVLPFLQLTLGLRGKISKNLHLLAEVGVWNGLILRGGIALRL